MGGGKTIKNHSEGSTNDFLILSYIAAFAVIYGHCFVLVGTSAAPDLFGIGIHGIGLIVTFIISGYLGCGSYERSGNYLKYVFKRYKRIMCPLLLCVIITSTLDVFAFNRNCGINYYLKFLILKIVQCCCFNIPTVSFGLNDNPYPSILNGSLWSMPVLFFLILFLPLEKYIARLKNKSLIFLLHIILGITSWLAYKYFNDSDLYFLNFYIPAVLRYAPYFFGGAILYYFSDILNGKIGILLLIISVLFEGTFGEVLSLLVLPYSMISFARDGYQIIGKRKKTLYYELYLYGFPITQYLIYFLKVQRSIEMSVLAYALLTLIIDIPIAYVTNFLIEWTMERIGVIKNYLFIKK